MPDAPVSGFQPSILHTPTIPLARGLVADPYQVFLGAFWGMNAGQLGLVLNS